MLKLCLISFFCFACILFVNMPFTQAYLKEIGLAHTPHLSQACRLNEVPCYFDVFGKQYELQIDLLPIQLETPHKLSLSGDFSGISLDANLEGLSMNMGIMPLRQLPSNELKQVDTSQNARVKTEVFELFVAACVEKKMDWVINVTFTRGDESVQKLILFTSDQ